MRKHKASSLRIPRPRFCQSCARARPDLQIYYRHYMREYRDTLSALKSKEKINLRLKLEKCEKTKVCLT